MFIYWKEECKYCINNKGCPYKNQMKNFKEALSYMEKSVKGIYGSLKFNCDYFVINKDKYWDENTGECDK